MYTGKYGVATDTGRRREHNEDSHFADPAIGLFVVCDGMGGYQAGEVASALAVKTIADAVQAGYTLEQALESAHGAILKVSQEDTRVRGMGATAVALSLEGSDYEIAWVGDSRAYLWDSAGRVLNRLTRDHSLVQQMVDSGTLKPEEARNHPKGNVVTQALGAMGISVVSVDKVIGRLYAGQQVMLCSDGLTGELDDSEIADHLSKEGAIQEIAERLVDAANSRGGKDNITVILVPAPPESASRPASDGTLSMEAKELNQLSVNGKKSTVRKIAITVLIAVALLVAIALVRWLL
ncbi:MAG: serine/threonine-protein phosphatase [Deltaproteobacteria bacterium]|nr:serine/threonine-protein phosphatase [Deltaproteobacteria bacterium]